MAGGGAVSEGDTRADETGRAAVSFTAGPDAGPQAVSASVGGLPPAIFELEAVEAITVVIETTTRNGGSSDAAA